MIERKLSDLEFLAVADSMYTFDRSGVNFAIGADINAFVHDVRLIMEERNAANARAAASAVDAIKYRAQRDTQIQLKLGLAAETGELRARLGLVRTERDDLHLALGAMKVKPAVSALGTAKIVVRPDGSIEIQADQVSISGPVSVAALSSP
jgi:hypothetical protein